MKRPSAARKVLFALLTAELVLGCGASASMRAAERGDLNGLRAAIARERAACKLERAEVVALAKASADRELLQARPAEALARIEEARACARALSDPLEKLARSEGEVGAVATLALLETTAGDKDGAWRLRRYGASASAWWRAVAARAAVGEELGPARRTFYGDGDERVRLAALRAALERADRADRRPLLEAARLDPNPLARALASRALGSIADEDVVLALRDIYARADEGLRQSIVDAWAQRQAAEAGGLRELFRVAENERGAPTIEAAWVLLRFPRVDRAVPVGTHVILRAIADGLARDRVLAIMDAPLADPRVVPALRKAAMSSEPNVKAAALSRLAESAATRAEALRDLSAWAQTGSRDALHALVRAGDRAAARKVAEELASPVPETRIAAARLLIGAGELDRAADLLADRDAHVRMTVACAIVSTREE
jgi:HEAT repeat protein